MSESAWELIFMMFVLKLPIAYLIGVVWWAVRSQDQPFEPALAAPPEPEPCPWSRPRRRPHGRGPVPRPRARTAAPR